VSRTPAAAAGHDGRVGRTQVEDQLDCSLRDQARQLRDAITAFLLTAQRLTSLGSGGGWLGPASAAYDAALGTLRLELSVAEAHLNGALRDTLDAISAGGSSG
jgi:hypothetical protein